MKKINLKGAKINYNINSYNNGPANISPIPLVKFLFKLLLFPEVSNTNYY